MIAPPGQAADMVDIAGAIQPIRIVGIHQASAETGAFGMSRRRRQQAFQRIRGQERIGIEQQQPSHAIGLARGHVVGGGEAHIARQADQFDCRIVLFQDIGGTILTGIVDHDHPIRPPGLGPQVTQTVGQQYPAVKLTMITATVGRSAS